MKKPILVLASLLAALPTFAQEDYEYPLTPEEEFYYGEQINGDLSEFPEDPTYYEQMEMQEEEGYILPPDESYNYEMNEEELSGDYYEEL